VTSIIHSYSCKQEKEKEFLFTTGYDGLILIWHIEAIEMKLTKLGKEDERAQTTTSSIKTENGNSKIEESKVMMPEQKTQAKKNFKFIPNVKICINVLNQIKGNFLKKKEIFSLCFMADKELLYSGGLDTLIHCWNIDTGFYVNTLKVIYLVYVGT
jgi:WD40 repeat protein